MKDKVLIHKAAEFLGVSKATLRNWHKSGKLVPEVHPITKIRIYDIKVLEKLLEEAKQSKQK